MYQIITIYTFKCLREFGMSTKHSDKPEINNLLYKEPEEYVLVEWMGNRSLCAFAVNFCLEA